MHVATAERRDHSGPADWIRATTNPHYSSPIGFKQVIWDASYLKFTLLDGSLGDEFIGVDLETLRGLLDDLVHAWLGEHGLIYFIVAVATIGHLQHKRQDKLGRREIILHLTFSY